MAKVGWAMSEFIVVLCTTAPNESDKIAGALVKERLAACVNIVPIRSCYIWEGKLNMDHEEILIIKTPLSAGNTRSGICPAILQNPGYTWMKSFWND